MSRFVFVSAARVRLEPTASTPLGIGKIATEDRLFGAPLREVVVRPDQYQEIWFSPLAQFDWPARKVAIFGEGETPTRYVATDDVADAVVRLALADDPPRIVVLGGPDALTWKQAVEYTSVPSVSPSVDATSPGRRSDSAPSGCDGSARRWPR